MTFLLCYAATSIAAIGFLYCASTVSARGARK